MKTETNVWVANRTILISDAIDQSSMAISIGRLIGIIDDDNEKDEKEKNFVRKPVNIYLNTNGGSVYDSLALIEIIEGSKTPIHTYALGKCFSAGFNIFVSGHKRFVGKYATLLWHGMSSGTYGDLKSISEDVVRMVELQKILDKIVVEKTDIKQKRLDEVRNIKFDWFMTPQEAIKLKVADCIINEK